VQKNPPEPIKKPLCPAKNRMNCGFTLAELLVAVVAASVVSIGALGVYSCYYRLYLLLYGGYQKETAAALEELRRINPYVSGSSRER
jgi:prepilin-type N-terminal cleavage/methylation domain-containing protein